MDNIVLLINNHIGFTAILGWLSTLGAIIVFIIAKTKFTKKYEQLQEELAEANKKAINAENLSITDELTGIYNRRYINKRLKEELDHANRSRRPMHLLFIDLDKFKSVNDTLGHNAGDKILIQVSSILKVHIRNYDICGRYGGDEFIIILPETNKSHARKIAERISFDIKKTTDNLIGASIGITSFNPDDYESKKINAEEMLRKADAEMYKKKHAAKKVVA